MATDQDKLTIRTLRIAIASAFLMMFLQVVGFVVAQWRASSPSCPPCPIAERPAP